jgi:hypothetical protein
MKKNKPGKPPKFDLDDVMNDPDKKMVLAGMVDELSIALEQVKAKQQEVKAIRTEAKDSIGIPPRLLNKLVKEHMEKGTLDGEIKTLEDTKALADAIAV